MMLLELDPNIVKPGWTPLLITIGIALVMVLLFRSMRKQFRRVDAHFPENLPAAPGAAPSATDGGPDAAGVQDVDGRDATPASETLATPGEDERTRRV